MNNKMRAIATSISFIGLLVIIALAILSLLEVTPAYQTIPIILSIVTIILGFLQLDFFQNQASFLVIFLGKTISLFDKLITYLLKTPTTFTPSRRTYFKVMVVLLSSIQIFLLIYIFFLRVPQINTAVQVIHEPDSQSIGISDGQFVFDKSADGGNPEPLIYKENQRIANATHITIGVVIADLPTARSVLQGAYLAQKEANDRCRLPDCTSVRLLIVNSGKDSSYATIVAQQIIKIALQDHTFTGVIGWPVSTPSAINGIKMLTQSEVLVISSGASNNALSDVSPNFFRIIPPDGKQGAAAAQFALQALQAQNAAVFYDSTSSYGQGLALAFASVFSTEKTHVILESYPSYNSQALREALHNVLLQNPDMVYCACSSSDQQTLLADLRSLGREQIKFMGNETIYRLPDQAAHILFDTYFTALAFPDEWSILAAHSVQTPSLFTDYPRYFDPRHDHAGAYGYARPDQGTILSYDALNIFVEGYRRLAGQHESITPALLQRALATISVNQPYQGASGQIAFGSDGNPVNKIIFLLYLDKQAHFHLISKQGVFLAGSSSS